MKVEFVMICDFASVTREGKLNVLGIFRQIYVQKLPTRYLRFFVVAMLEGEMGTEEELRVQIMSPVKEMAMPQQVARVKFGPSGRAHMIFGVVNLPLKVTGEHKIQIYSKSNKLAEAGFEVMKVTGRQGSPVVN
jgi:hypothetical protein